MKEKIREALLKAGASHAGFARAGEISESVALKYQEWIEGNFHGEMEYLKRHIPLRRNTDNVLRGAKTVISMAFSYVPEKWRDDKLPYISAYAYGKDYHKVIRKLLKPAIENFKNYYGGEWRICIDSAPVEERYWATLSGIGKRGVNGAIITEKCGSLCFLAELLTTLEIEPDKPCIDACEGCGLCVKACPGGALRGDGTMDARKCINYLTIEKKSPLSAEETYLLKTATPGGIEYGCDLCHKVCPHNFNLSPTSIQEFHPR